MTMNKSIAINTKEESVTNDCYFMTQYLVLKVVNGKELFDKISKGEVPEGKFILDDSIFDSDEEIKPHSDQTNKKSNTKKSSDKILKKGLALKNYEIEAQYNQIRGKANGEVRSSRSTEENEILVNIFVDFVIKKHGIYYCVVGVSAEFGVSIHNFPKYINDNVLIPLITFFEKRYLFGIQLETFTFENKHLSKLYWEDCIREKSCYNDKMDEQLFLRVSSVNFDEIIEKNKALEKYFDTGLVKYIVANTPDLKFEKKPGRVKFQRNGMFGCLFFNTNFFSEFVESMIDKGFFGEKK